MMIQILHNKTNIWENRVHPITLWEVAHQTNNFWLCMNQGVLCWIFFTLKKPPLVQGQQCKLAQKFICTIVFTLQFVCEKESLLISSSQRINLSEVQLLRNVHKFLFLIVCILKWMTFMNTCRHRLKNLWWGKMLWREYRTWFLGFGQLQGYANNIGFFSSLFKEKKNKIAANSKWSNWSKFAPTNS